MTATLQTSAFLDNLPPELLAPTSENAMSVKNNVVSRFRDEPLAQRKYIRLAKRLFPKASDAFQVLEKFRAEAPLDHDVTVTLNGKDLSARLLRDEESLSYDWYLSQNSDRYFSSWYSTYYFDRLSFQICDVRTGNVVLTVPCTIFRDGSLEYFNQPIKMIFAPGIAEATDHSVAKLRRQTLALAIKQLEYYCTEYLAYSFLVCADSQLVDHELFLALAGRPVFASVRAQPLVNILDTDQVLMKGFRKSHKGLIRGGLRRYTYSYVSAETIDHDSTTLVKTLVTTLGAGRFQPNWAEVDVCLQFCRGGQGEVQIARDIGDKIVGVNVFIDDGVSALYALGAYSRSDPSPPVSHSMVFNAVVRARSRGLERVCMSHVAGPRFDLHNRRLVESPEAREGYKFFKLGFANEVRRSICYRVLPKITDQVARS